MSKLKSPLSGRISKAEIVSDESKILGGGLEGTVDTVNIRVGDKDNSVSWQMARKVFENNEYAQKYWEAYLKNWQELKKRGMPVVPTVRFEEGAKEHYIIMTDLTQGGKNEVVALNDFEPSQEEKDYMARIDGRERIFKYPKDYILKINNSREISEEVSRLFELACEKGVILEHDMIFLIIDNETRNGHLLLGDLRTVEFMSDEEVLNKPAYEESDEVIYMEQKNHQELEDWCRFINENLSNENKVEMTHLNESFVRVYKALDRRRKELGIPVFDEDEDWW